MNKKDMTARKLTIIALFSVTTLSLVAQSANPKLWLEGKITVLDLSDSSEKAVGGVPVQLFCDTILIANTESSRSGHYQLQLDFESIYTLKFGGVKYMQKTISIDATQVDGKTLRKGYRVDLDISLFFNDDPDVALVLSQPIAKAYFDRRSDQFVFDEDYVEERLRLLANALK